MFSIYRYLFCLLALYLVAPAQAAVSLDRQGFAELAGHLELLAPAQSNLSVDQINAGFGGKFLPLPGHLVLGFGQSREVWLRFDLRTEEQAGRNWYLRVLPPILDGLDLYWREGDGPWRSLHGGDRLPFAARPVPDRAFVFPLELEASRDYTFYLRIRQDGYLSAYLALYSPEALHRLTSAEGLWFGLFFGILFALLVINGLHGYLLRELIYAEFIGYLLARGTYFLAFNGYVFQFLLPESPELAHQVLQTSVCLGIAAAILFLTRVLDMHSVFPRLALACYVMGVIAALFSLTVWLEWFTRLARWLTPMLLLVGLAGLTTVIAQIRRGMPYAWLFFVVVALSLGAISLSVLSSLGIHSSMFGDLYGSQLASAFSVLLLHFAVAMRVLSLKQAHAVSDKAAQLAAENAARERAARREQADFVAMLFHEVKTPLAVIDSAAAVLEHLDDGSRPQTGRRYDAIHGAVDRLNHLVEKSLALERQGLDEVYLRLSPLDLAEMAQGAAAGFADAGGARIRLDLPLSSAPVQADAELLRIALANLLDNALKYSPASAPVTLKLRPAAGSWVFTVSDQGPGIADTTRIFDRYRRGDHHAGASGAGLGLYLARRIAEAHGGALRVESELGRGSRFFLSLPTATKETPS